ncbi:MAG: rod shape-determining protein MreC [Chloroflexota bacterium]|nr:rod shape-determining protein MreC [Chloroflexota bacterium]
MAALGQVRDRSARKDHTALRQFAVLFILALVLLVSRNTELVQGASGAVTTALVPAQRALAQAGSSLSGFTEAINEIQTLRADNARLHDQVDQLTLENVRLREQAVAEQQAVKLDAVARTVAYQTIPAPVIARDPTGAMQTIVLGAGSSDGIAVGDVVVSDQGVVGRVSQVGSGYSKVLLVTDPGSAVSAIVQGSRATGIVRGQYGDTLVMDWILQTEQVSLGDVVITAGLSDGKDLRSLYPKGLVIGKVVALDRSQNSAYKTAIVLPAVDLRRLEHVLVIKTAP